MAKFTFDSEGLKTSINAFIQEYLSGLSDATRQAVQVEMQRITERTTELGFRAAQGDYIAAETLKDMQAQALLLIGARADDEYNRAISTAKLIIIAVLRTVFAAAVSGLPA